MPIALDFQSLTLKMRDFQEFEMQVNAIIEGAKVVE